VVRMARFRSGIAVLVLAGGLVAASGLPAMAAPAAPPTVTIAARSFFPPVTGDVFVLFRAPARFSTAQIHGKISGARSGEVARLFAQTFPFRHAPSRIAAVTLTGATATYSFTVAPALATRYRVEVFANGTATTPLASSAVSTVFLSNLMNMSGLSRCARPVCRERIRVVELVPASTLRTEIAKRWFFYFGLNLSTRGTPPPPRFLTLDTHAAISRSVRVSAGSFAVTISWSFRIGNDGFFFNFNFCNKDTEATDGLGLPGHHGCGDNRISAAVEYLG
jgi:hypothetical protein